MAASSDAEYTRWKAGAPLLYDWLSSQALLWPSLSCRWGPVLEDGPLRRRQVVYLSERTDGSEPNKLVVAEAGVCRARVAAADAVQAAADGREPPALKRVSTLLHPGEVNKIRELPSAPSVVVTHTDARECYVWHTGRQADRAGDATDAKAAPSAADLMLVGHADVAEFALAAAGPDGGGNAPPGAAVASGGRDRDVLVWNVADADGGAGLLASTGGGGAGGGGGASEPGRRPPTLAAAATLKGHTAPVEDVVFKPGSAVELASVGDDGCVLVWDTRASPAAGPASAVKAAHGPGSPDVQSVDWARTGPGHLATGCDKGGVRVWDVRKLTGANGAPAPLLELALSTGAVVRLEWSPTTGGVLASGGDDGVIALWDTTRGRAAGAGGGSGPVGRDGPTSRAAAAAAAAAAEGGGEAPLPPELFFQHAGHRAPIADFQWHPTEPFTMLSVSDDTDRTGGGGTAQMWRVSELITLPEADALALLRPHEEYILKGKVPDGPVGGGGGGGGGGGTATPGGGGAAKVKGEDGGGGDGTPAAGTSPGPGAGGGSDGGGAGTGGGGGGGGGASGDGEGGGGGGGGDAEMADAE